MKHLRRPYPRRILVIPLRFIGDTVLTVPLLRNLAAHYPSAQLDVLTSGAGAALLETCPYIHTCLPEPKTSLSLWWQLLKNNYDTVFLLRKSFTMALLCRLAGVQTVIGFDKQRLGPLGFKRWGLLLDYAVRAPGLQTGHHQVQHHLNLLKAVGLSVRDDYLELWPTDEDKAAVAKLLEPGGFAGHKLAILHTISASVGKSIAAEKFLPALQYLVEEGYRLITTGSANDQPIYETLFRQAGLPGKTWLNLAGKTTLRQTVALYQQAQFMLSIDSGPMHLAAAAGVPKIVGVYGPTNIAQWRPYATKVGEPLFEAVYHSFLHCRPCYPQVCSHNRCREDLKAEQILSGVRRLVKNS